MCGREDTIKDVTAPLSGTWWLRLNYVNVSFKIEDIVWRVGQRNVEKGGKNSPDRQ